MGTWMIRSCSDGTRLQTDLLSLLRSHQMVVRHVESDGPTRLRSPSAGEARPASARPTTVRGGSPAGRAPSGPRASRGQAGRGLVRGLRGARGEAEAVHGALELLERPDEVDAPRGSLKRDAPADELVEVELAGAVDVQKLEQGLGLVRMEADRLEEVLHLVRVDLAEDLADGDLARVVVVEGLEHPRRVGQLLFVLHDRRARHRVVDEEGGHNVEHHEEHERDGEEKHHAPVPS
mmetsp:Transcript_15840/g.47510  ORF Transcript_15840/g.47510 Transcript_15840/m.47510 type:complete len:235 (-) Transcript_15840:1598-2302(-)